MPAALDVDYTQAKLIYAATGSLKQASDQTGISYDAVRQRAYREQWEVAIKQAQEVVSQRVTTALGTARNTLEEQSKRAKSLHAKAAVTVAETLSEMDGQELLLSAQQMSHTAKHAALVFGWENSSNTVNLRLDVVAGQSHESPIIDIQTEAVE